MFAHQHTASRVELLWMNVTRTPQRASRRRLRSISSRLTDDDPDVQHASRCHVVEAVEEDRRLATGTSVWRWCG